MVIDIFSLIPIPLSSLHSVSQQLSAHSVPSFLLPCVIVRVSCSLLLPGGVYKTTKHLTYWHFRQIAPQTSPRPATVATCGRLRLPGRARRPANGEKHNHIDDRVSPYLSQAYLARQTETEGSTAETHANQTRRDGNGPTKMAMGGRQTTQPSNIQQTLLQTETELGVP